MCICMCMLYACVRALLICVVYVHVLCACVLYACVLYVYVCYMQICIVLYAHVCYMHTCVLLVYMCVICMCACMFCMHMCMCVMGICICADLFSCVCTCRESRGGHWAFYTISLCLIPLNQSLIKPRAKPGARNPPGEWAALKHSLDSTCITDDWHRCSAPQWGRQTLSPPQPSRKCLHS